jgi:choline dehydrogenase-like flavoprotein
VRRDARLGRRQGYRRATIVIGDLVEKCWDVIVVGAGLGGGIAGRRLAEKGLSVLFVESGPATPREDWNGWTAATDDPETRRLNGHWPDRVHAVIDGRASSFFAPIGTGVGGTSAFYAATLERPERHDLEDVATMPHPSGGWPVGYDAFLPYFEAAEDLLAVCGEVDPLSAERPAVLRAAPPMSAGDAAMMGALAAAGLHPYRKHVGARYLPGCAECFGRRCPRGCKMDGRSAGVEPALATGLAAVLDGCEVLALRGSRRQVTHLEAVRGGEMLRLRARRFVLAAGALGSPRLLLASASADWPNGCGNDTGLVGRNLMFKLVERIAIWPEHRSGAFRRRGSASGPLTAISLRDFYQRDGVRFGHVQSVGLDASYGDIVQHLKGWFDRSAPKGLRRARGLVRAPAFVAARVLGDAKIFQGLLEDLPYPDNRVVFDPADPRRIGFEYTISDELRARRRAFRALIRGIRGRRRSFFLHVEPELSLSHACGTLRFGSNPATSVLDPWCRSHAVPNLHVADASFMPTSTGINPSLTIAANAVRVADAIGAELGASGPRGSKLPAGDDNRGVR